MCKNIYFNGAFQEANQDVTLRAHLLEERKHLEEVTQQNYNDSLSKNKSLSNILKMIIKCKTANIKFSDHCTTQRFAVWYKLQYTEIWVSF